MIAYASCRKDKLYVLVSSRFNELDVGIRSELGREGSDSVNAKDSLEKGDVSWCL